MNEAVVKNVYSDKKQILKKMWVVMFLNVFVREFFVKTCLDFSIAQYMEDFYILNITKKVFALQIWKEKKNIFTDILECSINKKLL